MATTPHITVLGGSRGIGKALLDHFLANGWHGESLCRATGYDLDHDFQMMAEKSANSQLIINTVPSERFGQVLFLQSLFELVREKDCLVILLGSNNTDGIKNRFHPHSTSKAALEHALKQIQYLPSQSRFVLLKLGYVNTERSRASSQPKLQIEEIVKTVDWITRLPSDCLVRELYLSHKDMELDQ